MRHADGGPLAQIAFADDDGAGRAQARRDKGIATGLRGQRRLRARLHAVTGGDIVAQDDGDAMQGAAHLVPLPLAVHFQGNFQRIGIDFNAGIGTRADAAQGADTRQVLRRQRMRTELACLHHLLLRQDARIEQVGHGAGGRRGTGQYGTRRATA